MIHYKICIPPSLPPSLRNNISQEISVGTLTQKAKMASGCKGKDSWPELVGAEGKVAKATIERENPLVTALILHRGPMTPMTQDLRFDRVRVWVNTNGIVTWIPVIA
ncbi:unnamed protein product [Prunus brigantina]